jgi:transketolase
MLLDMRDAFFEELVLRAKQNSNIMILSADHGAYALEDFAKNYPNQYINIGIAEQNMVGVAAGLALSGKIVFVYGIAPFVSLRVLEQVAVDIALMQTPVNIVSVGAGFTYSTDGPTHQGLLDLNAISSIPNINILNSSDPLNTKKFVNVCLTSFKPHYIRIEKEKLAVMQRLNSIDNAMNNGYSLIFEKQESQLLLLSSGFLSNLISEMITDQEFLELNSFDFIDIHQFNPVSIALIEKIKNYKKILIFEESNKFIHTQLIKCFNGMFPNVKTVSVDSASEKVFLGSSRQEMLETFGFSKNIILNEIRGFA